MARVLLDHCMPRKLARLLVGHAVSTARERGWEDLSNGRLLAAAASGGFDAFLTVDGGIPDQQDTGVLPLAVIVIESVRNSLRALAPYAPDILRLLGQRPTPRVHVIPRRARTGPAHPS